MIMSRGVPVPVTVPVARKTTKLQWPRRLDLLDVLKVDILFSCQLPNPSPGTSSSRSITYSLYKEELKKAKHLFMLNKAYYPTSISTALVTVPMLCVHACVSAYVCVRACVCMYVCVRRGVCGCVHVRVYT
jgi:hypothetical protein